MPRANPIPNRADQARDPGTGEWQALRGELVALLDKVESRYGNEDAPEAPTADGLAERVKHLRDQVDMPEPASRRQEALRTVKRAVDRFSEPSAHPVGEMQDDLSAAIAEIRSRQRARPQGQDLSRSMGGPELRELGALVGGMSQRLESLEGELKGQRGDAHQVREVASQVEQLTQVVELLAGAVGETGQVRRLEAQIAALGAMIEEGSRGDVSAINDRLDDVSTTVGKLAELQAQQMEREIDRETRRAAEPRAADALAPAVLSIETSVRNVYDRIDAIERNYALSSGDFERLTSEMAAFTQAMQSGDGALVGRVEALAERLEGVDSSDNQVAGLKDDIASLRDAVLKSMEPRFSRIESQIEALTDRVDTSAVETQLKALMERMDDAGAQLDGLARLYSTREEPDFEALATLVAERAGDAVIRKAPAPVAMFGPDSLKSIEDRLTGLIKSVGKAPDYDKLADIVATRTSEAVAKVQPAAGSADAEGMEVLEKRMSALFNTAGKETAERLARLEAVLSGRAEPVEPVQAKPEPVMDKPEAVVASTEAAPIAPKTEVAPVASKAEAATVAPKAAFDPFAEALAPAGLAGTGKLDSILASLGGQPDAMPSNPADEAPLVDPGFERPQATKPLFKPTAAAGSQPLFDPDAVERPPRPQSSFAVQDRDPFAEPMSKPTAPEPVATGSSTSTFVAAARRAQRARQDQLDNETGSSVIGRALARVRPRKDVDGGGAAVPAPAPALAVPPVDKSAERKASKAEKLAAKEAAKAELNAPAPAPASSPVVEDEAPRQSFLVRHRRPILLAATLVAVSMLALNLVLQRMEAPSAEPAAAVTAPPEVVPAEPAVPAVEDPSAVTPRVIDMVETGSIDTAATAAPTASAAIGPVAPVTPAAIAPIEAATAPVAPIEELPEVPAEARAVPETFELPAEAVGPLALREAAAGGDAQAQFEVAAIFGEGRVLEQDLAEAAVWYERSAATGFAPAQYRLGNLYEMGSGVEKDLEEARLWYQRAADGGNRMAMHNLAALYAGGQLGEPDFELAAEWFEKAATRGMTDSQFNLGMLYARGLGVEQDLEQSYKWFSLAARSGDNDAAQARDDMAKSLSADAVSRVDGDVAAWGIEGVDLAANFAPMGTWSDEFDPGEAITGRDVILRVQQALGKLGFDIGSPDGVAGPKTADAIKAFERATGMSEVGTINPRLLAVLGSQPV